MKGKRRWGWRGLEGEGPLRRNPNDVKIDQYGSRRQRRNAADLDGDGAETDRQRGGRRWTGFGWGGRRGWGWNGWGLRVAGGG